MPEWMSLLIELLGHLDDGVPVLSDEDLVHADGLGQGVALGEESVLDGGYDHPRVRIREDLHDAVVFARTDHRDIGDLRVLERVHDPAYAPGTGGFVGWGSDEVVDIRTAALHVLLRLCEERELGDALGVHGTC